MCLWHMAAERRKQKFFFCFRLSLVGLEKGIKGFEVMSPSMEETFSCIYDARVPPLWEKVQIAQFWIRLQNVIIWSYF